jgi:hypothetical protein
MGSVHKKDQLLQIYTTERKTIKKLCIKFSIKYRKDVSTVTVFTELNPKWTSSATCSRGFCTLNTVSEHSQAFT